MNDILSPVFATVPTLKLRAKRLRDGTEMTHSQALEALAHQAGLRDWNTLVAKAAPKPTMQWLKQGDMVAGRYLGQPFVATLHRLQSSFAGGVHGVVLRFSEPLEITPGSLLGHTRRQIHMEINDDGISDNVTSDGQPHLVIEL